MNEDLVRQIASSLTEKLLKGSGDKTPRQATTPLIIFGEETTEPLKSQLRNAIARAEFTEKAPTQPNWSNYTQLVLVAPSLDLVSKIRQLQTDCPTAKLTVDALCQGKRVLAVTDGVLSNNAPALPAGLARAIGEMRQSLTEMGIELISAQELDKLAATLTKPAKASCGCQKTDACGCNSSTSSSHQHNHHGHQHNHQHDQHHHGQHSHQHSHQHSNGTSLASLPVIQHPSQQRLSTSDQLTDFIEFLQTKPCRMEKDKPCDNCDICNTLGF